MPGQSSHPGCPKRSCHTSISITSSPWAQLPSRACLMPQTIAYASNGDGVYFSMPPEDELTLRDVGANRVGLRPPSTTTHPTSGRFGELRRRRTLRADEPSSRSREIVLKAARRARFADLPVESLRNLRSRSGRFELHFVDYEYTAGIAVPMEVEHRLCIDGVRRVAGAVGRRSWNISSSNRVRSSSVRGSDPDRFFIIVDGEVEVRREGHGQDVVVTRHGPGQLFGEVGALTGSPQTATFVAMTKTVVMAVRSRSSFPQDFVTQTAAADTRTAHPGDVEATSRQTRPSRVLK